MTELSDEIRKYWQRRQRELEKGLEESEAELKKRLAKYYAEEAKRLDNLIAQYYQKYGRDNVLEYNDLLESLDQEDIDLLYRDIYEFNQKYPEYAYLNDTATSIYKLNRLQGLQESIRLQQESIGAAEQDLIGSHLMKNAEQALNIFPFNTESKTLAEMIVNQKWSSEKDFSSRIWDNKEKLIGYLQDDFSKGVVRGESYSEMSKALRQRFQNVSRNDAFRLVYTEGTHVLAEANARNAEKYFDYYDIVTAGDDRVCSICSDIASQSQSSPFAYKDRETGVNFPPFHPWCRCTIEPAIPDENKWLDDHFAMHDHSGITSSDVQQVEQMLGIDLDKPLNSNGLIVDKLHPAYVAGIERTKEFMTIQEAVSNANPNYDPDGFSGFYNNCQRCVPTYEARRRGYEVEALPCRNKEDPVLRNWDKLFENQTWVSNLGETNQEVQNAITKQMNDWGNYSRAAIKVSYKRENAFFNLYEIGHTFIAENENGRVRYIDPQTGESDVTDEFKAAVPMKTEISRIDNLEFSKWIGICCKGSKR